MKLRVFFHIFYNVSGYVNERGKQVTKDLYNTGFLRLKSTYGGSAFYLKSTHASA